MTLYKQTIPKIKLNCEMHILGLLPVQLDFNIILLHFYSNKIISLKEWYQFYKLITCFAVANVAKTLSKCTNFTSRHN